MMKASGVMLVIFKEEFAIDFIKLNHSLQFLE